MVRVGCGLMWQAYVKPVKKLWNGFPNSLSMREVSFGHLIDHSKWVGRCCPRQSLLVWRALLHLALTTVQTVIRALRVTSFHSQVVPLYVSLHVVRGKPCTFSPRHMKAQLWNQAMLPSRHPKTGEGRNCQSKTGILFASQGKGCRRNEGIVKFLLQGGF